MTAEVAQDMWELERLLAIAGAHKPDRVLEVGVWHGGTLQHWLRMAGHVTAVDDTMFETDEWQEWAQSSGASLNLIQGDSHSADVVEQARKDGPYDLVFIDADHTYDAVKADWENYGPMCAPGGLVVFHDIAERPEYGVAQLWAELRPGRRTLAIWAGAAAYCGIGVVFQ